MSKRGSALLRAGLLAALLVVLVAACDDDPLDEDPIEEDPADEEVEDDDADEEAEDDDAEAGELTVGSADFLESQLLAEMFAIQLEDAGYEVDRNLNIGAREVYFPALEDGEIDVLPEYLGALLAFLQDDDVVETETEPLYEDLLAETDERGVTVLEPSDAENRNSLVVTQETAEEYDLEVVSDLAPVADELVMGGPPEYRERFIGLPGLEEVYGIQFQEFVDLDAGGPLTIEALGDGDVDVAALFTTQGVIGANDWVVLEEDEPLIPAENILATVRDDAVDDEVSAVLEEILDALTEDELVELNRRMEIDNEDPDQVAEDFLEDAGLR